MKTQTKLLILITVILLCAGGGTGFYLWRKAQMLTRVASYKPKAYDAIEQRDYQAAQTDLGAYLNHNPDDIEALYAYANLQLRLPEASGQHLRKAIPLFRKVIATDLNHLKAHRVLFDIYSNSGMLVEADQLAGQLISLDPKNIDILTSYAQVLMAMKRYNDNPSKGELGAESILLQALAVEPHRLDIHLSYMQARTANQVARRANRRYAEGLAKKYPEDSRYVLLQAVNYALEGELDKAAALTDSAAEQLVDDEHYIRLLTRMFEQRTDGDYKKTSVRFAASMDILNQARQQFPESEALMQLFAQRLWELGEGAALLDYLKDVSNDSAESPTWAIRLKALAFSMSGQKDLVAILAENLEARVDDPLAVAWGEVLKAGFVEGAEADPQTLANICQGGLIQTSNAPYLYFILATVQTQLKNTDQAKRAWNSTMRLAPAWGQPFTRMAQLANSEGDFRKAAIYAGLALERSPNSMEAAITMIIAASKEEGLFTSEELIEACRIVQQQIPQEPQTLAIFVKLLADAGEKEEAVTVLQAAAKADPPLPESVLYQLVIVSQQASLGMGDQLIEVSSQVLGTSPAIAFLQARQMFETDGAEAAIKLYDALQVSAKSTPENNLKWQIIHAELLTLFADANANIAWATLGDQNAENIDIQRVILSKPFLQGERDLIDRTIERFRKFGGINDALWRVARARWIMTSGGGKDSFAQAALLLNEAIKLSPGKVEPHFLLARCLTNLDSTEGSIDHLRKAMVLKPESIEIGLVLASQLSMRGDHQSAKKYLDQVNQNNEVTPEQSLRAAMMLMNSGDSQAALGLAQKIVPDGSVGQALYLVSIYDRAGEIDTAVQLTEDLLASDEGSTHASALQFAAQFFAKIGQTEKADAALARYQQLELPQHQKDLATAAYLQKYGDKQQAIEKFQLVLEQTPDNIAIWLQLAAMQAQGGNYEQAFDVIAQGIAKNPDQADFRAIIKHRQLAIDNSQAPMLTPIIFTVFTDARYRDIAVKILELAKDVRSGLLESSAMLNKLKTIANKDSEYLQGQYLLVRSYLLAQQHDEARFLATRLMTQYPIDPMPAYLATQIAAEAKDWGQVVRYAQVWVQRLSGNDTLMPDMILAQAYLELKQNKKALEAVTPHVDQVMASPQIDFQRASLCMRVLVVNGQVSKARQWLEPRLAQDFMWYEIWCNLAASYVLPESEAIAWLEKIAEVADESEIEVWRKLVTTWGGVAERFNNLQYKIRGLEIVIELADRPTAEVGTLSLASRLHNEFDVSASYIDRVQEGVGNDSAQLFAVSNMWKELGRRLENPQATQKGRDIVLELVSQIEPAPGVLIEAAADTASQKQAIEFLNQLSQRVDPESVQQLTQMAQGWLRVSGNHQTPVMQDAVAQQVSRALSHPDVEADIVFEFGAMAEGNNNLPLAEKCYRQALDKNPGLVIAKNNLAMTITNRNGDLKEALNFAMQASHAYSSVPSFYDTIAHVLTQDQQFEKALVEIQKAIRIEPGNPMWQLKRIEILLESGDKKTSLKEFNLFDKEYQDQYESHGLIERVEALKSSIKG